MSYKLNPFTGIFDVVTTSISSSSPSGYVPYVGATSSVNLGIHKLIASAVTAGSFTASTTAQPFITGSTQLNTNFNADLLDGRHAATFQTGGTYVTDVTGTSPISSSGGTTPAISIDTSSLFQNVTTGSLSATTPLSVTSGRQVLGGSASITIDTANLVPYVGANSNVNLGSYFLTATGITANNVAIPTIFTRTAEPTGFLNRGTTFSFDNGTRTFSITGTHNVYLSGVEYIKGTTSIQIANTDGIHWIYYGTDGVIAETTASPNLATGNAFISTVFWNTTTTASLLGDERHGIKMDGDTHSLLHYTVGTRYESGLSSTFTNTTFLTAAGRIDDEDLPISISATSACIVFYKNGSVNYQFDGPQAAWYKSTAGVLQYNNVNALADVTNNKYCAYWCFASNDIANPIIFLMGQREDINLADARSSNTYDTLVLGSLPYQEMKLLYRVIARNQGGTPTYIEAADYRSVTNLPSGTYVATRHDALTGLNWSVATHTFDTALDTGAYGVTANNFSSTTTAQPFVTSSTQINTNFNADLLDGLHSSSFLGTVTTGTISGTSPIGATAGRQALGGALAISIDTTNLFANVTTGAFTATSPLSLDNTRQVLGGALVASINTSSLQATITSANLASSTSALVIGSAGTGAILKAVTMSIASATTTQTGLLTSTDWGIFNNKWATQTTGHIIAGSNISLTGGTGTVLGANVTIAATMETGGPTQPGGSQGNIQYNLNTTFGGNNAFALNATSFAVSITPASGDVALNIKQAFKLVLDN